MKVGLRHPDPVVETSSLSSVNPPDVWYRVSIPEETIDRGCLSALQLEAITYAAQVTSQKWTNKPICKNLKDVFPYGGKVMYTMLLYRSNMRLFCLEGNVLAIWLVMEPVWGKAGLSQASFMRITFWAGRDHFGKWIGFLLCRDTHNPSNESFLAYLPSQMCIFSGLVSQMTWSMMLRGI